MMALGTRRAAAASLSAAIRRLFPRRVMAESVAGVDRLLGFEPLDKWWPRVAGADDLIETIRRDGDRRRALADQPPEDLQRKARLAVTRARAGYCDICDWPTWGPGPHECPGPHQDRGAR